MTKILRVEGSPEGVREMLLNRNVTTQVWWFTSVILACEIQGQLELHSDLS